MLNPLKLISKIFKSSNQKQLDQLQAIVEQVNNYEKNISSLANEDFPKKIIHEKYQYNVFFKEKNKRYETVMEAVGRVPNLKKLNPNKAKIKLSYKIVIKF